MKSVFIVCEDRSSYESGYACMPLFASDSLKGAQDIVSALEKAYELSCSFGNAVNELSLNKQDALNKFEEYKLSVEDNFVRSQIKSTYVFRDATTHFYCMPMDEWEIKEILLM